MSDGPFVRDFLLQSRVHLTEDFLPKIQCCLELLSEKEVWWRPNENSNSIGNLLLHLEGNVRQWIIAGLGGTPDTRQRSFEFQERGELAPGELFDRLATTVEEAVKVLENQSTERLLRSYDIQVYSVTGIQAILHVVEHFSHHTGQIIYITKLLKDRDLRFYDH